MSNQQMPPPQQPQYGYPPQPPHSQGSNGLAIAGFILGLLGLLGSWIPLLNIVAILLAVVGLVLAGVGLARSKKVNSGKGLAIAGLVLSVLAILLAVLVNSAFSDAVDDVTNNSVSAPSDDDSDASDSSAEEDSSDGSDAGTSRDKPVPLGSSITGGEWTVTLNSVKQVQADSFGASAKPGSTLLQINIDATYNGKDEQGTTPFVSIDYVTPEGDTVSGLDGSTLFIPEKQFDTLKTVYPGKSLSGDQIIEVPEQNWRQGVLAVTPDLLSDATFVAVSK